MVLVAAVIVFPPLGVALVLVAANALGVAIAEDIVFAGIALVGELKKLASPSQEKAAIDACQDKALAKCETCTETAQKLPFPLNFAAMDSCGGALLLDYAVCLLI